MFGRKKAQFPTSFTKDFSSQSNSTTPPVQIDEQEDEVLNTEPTSAIERLYNELVAMIQDSLQWDIVESGFDEYDYTNYVVTHRTKPIVITYDSYDNENIMTILFSQENIDSFFGYGWLEELNEQVYDLIYENQERIEEERNLRNEESAKHILKMLGIDESF